MTEAWYAGHIYDLFGEREFTASELAESLRPYINPAVAARVGHGKRRGSSKAWLDDVTVGLRTMAYRFIWNRLRSGRALHLSTGVYRFCSKTNAAEVADERPPTSCLVP